MAIVQVKDLIEAVRRGGDESMLTGFFDQLRYFVYMAEIGTNVLA